MTRRVVLKALARQPEAAGLCRARPKITLCLAAGRLRPSIDHVALAGHFDGLGWRLITPMEIVNALQERISTGYENDTAFVVAKLLGRQAKTARLKGAM